MWFLKILNCTNSFICKNAWHFQLSQIICSKRTFFRIWRFYNSLRVIHKVYFYSTEFGHNRLHSNSQNQVNDFKRRKKDITFNSELEDLSDWKLNVMFLFVIICTNLKIIYFSQFSCIVTTKKEDDFLLKFLDNFLTDISIKDGENESGIHSSIKILEIHFCKVFTF